VRTALGPGALLVAAPALAWAAGADGPGDAGPALFALAVLLSAAKVGGLLSGRLGQPSVLGELLVGIVLANLVAVLLGAQGIEFARSNATLQVLAEAGVLILLFDVGLEADLRALVRVGPSSLLVALIGIVAPFALGWGAAAWLLPASPTLAHVFVGATLTATSVGITARVLQDLGATRSPAGQTIIGAAILDDVLGLIVLAVVGGLVKAAAGGGPGLSGLAIVAIIVKAVLFLGVTVALGHWLSGPLVRLVGRAGQRELILVVGLALCFTLALVAERLGLAGIVGAFAAGLLLDPYGRGVRAHQEEATLAELLHPLSALFVPLFFVLMGLQVDLSAFADPGVLGFGVALTLCALAGKLACAVGVIAPGIDRVAVAIGMVPRGEVGLIFAGIGASLTLDGAPVLSQGAFSSVILMVLVTTLVAPIGLRRAFARAAAPPG
jgi:Kef-type K+ transport system membrane component KefB